MHLIHIIQNWGGGAIPKNTGIDMRPLDLKCDPYLSKDEIEWAYTIPMHTGIFLGGDD